MIHKVGYDRISHVDIVSFKFALVNFLQQYTPNQRTHPSCMR